MGKGYLIDTNVIIDYAAGRLPIGGQALIAKLINAQPVISVISKIELLGFKDVPETIVEFVSISEVLLLEDNVIGQTIELRKSNRMKLPDAIIAATAITHDLILVTRNEKDFAGIGGFQVVNPHQI
jgi:predicted nucleic acid-binding protein